MHSVSLHNFLKCTAIMSLFKKKIKLKPTYGHLLPHRPPQNPNTRMWVFRERVYVSLSHRRRPKGSTYVVFNVVISNCFILMDGINPISNIGISNWVILMGCIYIISHVVISNYVILVGGIYAILNVVIFNCVIQIGYCYVISNVMVSSF